MNRLVKIAAAVGALISSPGLADDIAVVGGTVHTRIGDPIENGVVLIRDGRIEAVGPDLAVPDGYRVVDASGKQVTPGIMNAYTQATIVEVGSVDGSNDASFEGDGYSAALDVSYAVNPRATGVAITRVEGVTRLAVTPTIGDDIFAGQGAIVHLGNGDDIVARPRAFMLAAFGERGAGKAGGSRGAAMAKLITAIEEAARYRESRAKAEWEGLIPRTDAAALVPVTTGDIPLMIIAHRASDLTQIITLSETYTKLDIIIAGANEGWLVADDLAKAEISVILHPLDNLPMSFEALASTQRNAGRLADAGVKVAFGSVSGFGAYQPRLALQLAGNAVANGMTWDAAMAALTTNPAEIFGIDADYGTLSEGKVADVVVWDGDPLELMTSPDAVIINGEIMPMTSRQIRLRDRYNGLEGDKPFAYRK